MNRTRRTFNWLFASTGLLLALLWGLYRGRHVLWGKSLSFYSTTGLRMPLDAHIVAEIEHYPLPQSNEGESLLVFDITATQSAAYLTHTPWQEDRWHKGPIPSNFLVSGAQTISPYWNLWHSSRLWYTAYGKAKGYYDGQLLVIDPKTNRVFLLDWNH